MKRVLFVCAGNTCRSPMAAALLRRWIAELGLAERVQVDSAGVSATPGDPINSQAAGVLAAHGLPGEHRARRFSPADWVEADLIVAMDYRNLAAVFEQRPPGPVRATACLLLDFAPAIDLVDVPDPYGTNHYAETFDLIARGVEGLLARLRRDWGV